MDKELEMVKLQAWNHQLIAEFHQTRAGVQFNLNNLRIAELREEIEKAKAAEQSD